MSAVFVRGESAGGIQNGVTFVQTDKQEIDVSQEELPTCRKDQRLENVFAVVANDKWRYCCAKRHVGVVVYSQ